MPDQDFTDIAAAALAVSSRPGASYVDCRITHLTEEEVRVANGQLETLSREESLGMGVRVLAHGAWGFASTAELSVDQARRLGERAYAIAGASAKVSGEPVELSPVKAVHGSYQTPIETDPFSIPLAEKREYLMDLDAAIRQTDEITRSGAHLFFRREYRYFFSSEGAQIDQKIYQSGAGITAGAGQGHRDVIERSFPTSGGQYETAGHELVEKLQLESGIEKIAEEVRTLGTANPCPSMTGTVILSGDLTSLQVHESIGHPLELDRVYGSERNFSGTSFATPALQGTLRYGSKLVTVYTDPTAPGGLGTFGYDDEGIPAIRTPLILNGILSGYLTSRETARKIGSFPNASMRAKSWAYLPIIRMTNTNLQPGNTPLEQMIAETDNGIYIETPTSWSIDDRRENFQLGGEIGWLIKGGKRTEIVKNPTYSGNTVEFWNSCDAIGTEDEYQIWGTPACGKGQPGQTLPTGQGTAPARFQNVRIGRD